MAGAWTCPQALEAGDEDGELEGCTLSRAGSEAYLLPSGEGETTELHRAPKSGQARNFYRFQGSAQAPRRFGLSLLGVVAFVGVWKNLPRAQSQVDSVPAQSHGTPRAAISLAVVQNSSCVDAYQDCRLSRCCKQAGHKCFEKNGDFAMCMAECAPGVRETDKDRKPWSCNLLSDQSKFAAGSCSWPGQECIEKQWSCCSKGFECIRKDSSTAVCQQAEVGPWTNGVPANRVPVPPGWQGEVLGWWRDEYQAPAAQPWQQEAQLTLFCFFAVLPGSPEEGLVQLARERKASIFGCEEHAIYHSSPSKFHTWEDTGVSTLVNTASFVKVWDQVREGGLYLKTAWTVKVDADAIFFPDRLRSHLDRKNVPADTPIYVKNTLARFTLGGFLGAIEILSQDAVSKFLANATECGKHIGMVSGEDGFLKDCADALGVGYIHDEILLHPSPNPIECQLEEFVAFHPMKAPGEWVYCYDIAAGNNRHPPPEVMGLVNLLPPVLQPKYAKLAKAAEAAAAAAAAKAAAAQAAAAKAAAAKAADATDAASKKADSMPADLLMVRKLTH